MSRDGDACKTGGEQGRPGAFRPGTSGNPRGRPRAGLALSERIREMVDPSELVGIVLAIARDPGVAVKHRLAAVTLLADRGWSRPPAAVEIEASTTVIDALAMSPAEREAEIKRLLAKREAHLLAQASRS
jgi:hypothetical protein